MSVESSIEERIASLTPRERDVLDHLVRGLSNKLIGGIRDKSANGRDSSRTGDEKNAG